MVMKYFKNICFPLLVIMTLSFITSCSRTTKFEKMAKEQMEATFKRIAKHPSSVKLLDIETVYCDDSLCIIHCDFSAKNDLGADVTDKYEYILISSNGKNYESYMEINHDEDCVFVSPDEYKKNKKGTIYERLSYKTGLRYLAALYVNSTGEEVGVKSEEIINIPVPTGTGSWELGAYIDEFGEKGSQKYLLLTGSGVYSNSATTDSRMTAILFIDKDYFSFRLLDDDSGIIKTSGSYKYRIKASDGDIYEMILYNNNLSGQMASRRAKDRKRMEAILAKGGVISVYVKEMNAFSTPDTYLFKLNVEGYMNAKTFLK